MTTTRERVVVTGIGVICPLGRDASEFWTNLVAGRSGVALVAAREALAQSGLADGTLRGDETGGERVGIVVGQCQVTDTDDPKEFLPFHEPADSVAEHWGFVGPRIVLSNACAASPHTPS